MLPSLLPFAGSFTVPRCSGVALPTIARDLSVPLDRVDGAVTGFLISLAVFIPASGWLGDRFLLGLS